ncbi:MAG: hypothetical protein CVU89_05255 [Firmicutes bacterium HGW-Firmicutes-14]|jgi:flagellar operon protein (TIGR03826 family)|nr:MAG: hypothetical protein CVU89_05255 [Firmicutes bacterium HGW-Firmicutes-14]
MANLSNCPECGKVFVRMSKNLCPDCIDQEEKEFEEVRAYLKDNPGASVEEISGVTGADEKKILRWMREGRLEVSFTEGGSLTCKSCGASIISGNYCARCAREMSDKLRGVSKPVPADEKTDSKSKQQGMFIADRIRKD